MNTSIETKIGGRKENQDFSGETNTRFGKLIMVCDGMGGYAGGSLASKIAVKVIIEELENPKSEDARNALHNAIQKANFEIFRRTVKETKLKGMGTTLTLLLVQKEKALVGHVGDSRVYQIRNKKVVFKTIDHSKVAEMVKRGILSEDDARNHDDSNVILRALGIDPVVDIDFQELEYKKADRFILCTDGIHGMISEKELVNLASKKGTTEEITKNLVDQVDSIGKSAGNTHDNLTVAIIELEENPVHKTAFRFKTVFPYGIILLLALYIVVSPFVETLSNLSFKKQDNLGETTLNVSLDDLEKLKNQKAKLTDSINTLVRELESSKSDFLRLQEQMNQIRDLSQMSPIDTLESAVGNKVTKPNKH